MKSKRFTEQQIIGGLKQAKAGRLSAQAPCGAWDEIE